MPNTGFRSSCAIAVATRCDVLTLARWRERLSEERSACSSVSAAVMPKRNVKRQRSVEAIAPLPSSRCGSGQRRRLALFRLAFLALFAPRFTPPFRAAFFAPFLATLFLAAFLAGRFLAAAFFAAFFTDFLAAFLAVAFF